VLKEDVSLVDVLEDLHHFIELLLEVLLLGLE
jgi:hypothetical protein